MTIRSAQLSPWMPAGTRSQGTAITTIVLPDSRGVGRGRRAHTELRGDRVQGRRPSAVRDRDGAPGSHSDPRYSLSESACADDSDVHLPSLLKLRCEQVAHHEAPVRSPGLCQLDQLCFSGKVMEPIQPLNRVPQREVA